MAGRHTRFRLSHLADPNWQSAIALVVGLMALIVVLPIPFGNLLPVLALMLIGLGLVFRDGVAVILGLMGAGLASFIIAGLMLMAWGWGSALILGEIFS
ncbi:exopolysaccharide biosynthesis protein (plasmid) [Ralstonia solanacearum]|uniref:exopolysaccharide biosynthesis protein n=1 Tax=Ralstonia solanacearum TaxID=305 RepID=UPI0032162884